MTNENPNRNVEGGISHERKGELSSMEDVINSMQQVMDKWKTLQKEGYKNLDDKMLHKAMKNLSDYRLMIKITLDDMEKGKYDGEKIKFLN